MLTLFHLPQKIFQKISFLEISILRVSYASLVLGRIESVGYHHSRVNGFLNNQPVQIFKYFENSENTIREGFKKKEKKKGWIYPSGLAAWGQPGSKIQPKKLLLKLLQTT